MIRNNSVCAAHFWPLQMANTKRMKDQKASPETWEPLLLTDFSTFPGAPVMYLPAGAADSDCPLVKGSNLLKNVKDRDSYKWNRHLQLNGEAALTQAWEDCGWKGASQVKFQVLHWPLI